MITTQTDLRAAFWEAHPDLTRHGRRKQNDYPADTRIAWVDYVDSMERDGQINVQLAQRATL